MSASRLVEILTTTARREGLFDGCETVIVGFSGGADSTALLAALVEAAPRFAYTRIIAAHLNHLMRPEASSDVTHCRGIAKKLGAEFTVSEADVLQFARTSHVSVEVAGRNARYRFFEEVASDKPAARIATAHNANDNAETALFHLLRGAGLRGGSGIPVKRGQIVRPLLLVLREEIHLYVRAKGLPYIHDTTNDDTDRTRSWIRGELLPLLKKRVNPRVVEALSRFAVTAGLDDAFLDEMALNVMSERQVSPRQAIDDPSVLAELPLPIAKRALRIGYETLTGRMPDQLQLDARLVCIDRPSKLGSSVQWKTLHLPLSTVTPVTVDCWNVIMRAADPANIHMERDRYSGIVDVGSLRGGLFVRFWARGDRIRTVGFEHTRKLSDLFVNSKLARDERHRLPLVCDDEGIVWVPGIGIADRVKVTDQTKSAFRLDARRAEE